MLGTYSKASPVADPSWAKRIAIEPSSTLSQSQKENADTVPEMI
jgi:hypothetical protein